MTKNNGLPTLAGMEQAEQPGRNRKLGNFRQAVKRRDALGVRHE